MADTTPSAEALAACPFCGTQPDHQDMNNEHGAVECPSCGVQGPSSGSAAQAIVAWNRRAALSAEPKAQAGTVAIQALLASEEAFVPKRDESDMVEGHAAGFRNGLRKALELLAAEPKAQAQAAATNERIVETVAELGSECYRARDGLWAALTELVAVKELKERYENLCAEELLDVSATAERDRLLKEYLCRQPAAWAAARAILAGTPAPSQAQAGGVRE